PRPLEDGDRRAVGTEHLSRRDRGEAEQPSLCRGIPGNRTEGEALRARLPRPRTGRPSSARRARARPADGEEPPPPQPDPSLVCLDREDRRLLGRVSEDADEEDQAVPVFRHGLSARSERRPFDDRLTGRWAARQPDAAWRSAPRDSPPSGLPTLRAPS